MFGFGAIGGALGGLGRGVSNLGKSAGAASGPSQQTNGAPPMYGGGFTGGASGFPSGLLGQLLGRYSGGAPASGNWYPLPSYNAGQNGGQLISGIFGGGKGPMGFSQGPIDPNWNNSQATDQGPYAWGSPRSPMQVGGDPSQAMPGMDYLMDFKNNVPVNPSAAGNVLLPGEQQKGLGPGDIAPNEATGPQYDGMKSGGFTGRTNYDPAQLMKMY